METSSERFKITSIEKAELFIPTSSALRNPVQTNSVELESPAIPVANNGSTPTVETIENLSRSESESITPPVEELKEMNDGYMAQNSVNTNDKLQSPDIECTKVVVEMVETVSINNVSGGLIEVETDSHAENSEAIDPLLVVLNRVVSEDSVYQGSAPKE